MDCINYNALKERLKITKETVKEVVTEKLNAGLSQQEIEDEFKLALKQKSISVDVYCAAMEVIYAVC